MKRRMVSLLALVLALALLGTAVAETPEYLNLDGYAPIVNGDPIQLTIAVPQNDIQGEAKDIWFWTYAREVMNIDFDVVQTASAAEYKQLVFASGDLPDILFNLDVNTETQMTYGAGEGMLLALDAYMTPELMPNLTARMAENELVQKVITAPDGHVYSFGKIGEANNEGSCPRVFINTTWLEEAGLETPATLDEFINMLTAFKAKGEDIIPLGGGYNAVNPCVAILSAFGYNTNDAKGLSIAMRNGEAVFPFGDREAYGAYLTTMNKLYTEGLIDREFYTTDTASARALMAENRTGVFAEPAYLSVPATYAEWWAMIPLTSEYSEKPVWFAAQDYTNTGVFSVSAECEYPELAARFADFWYDPLNCFLACYGPHDSELDLALGVADVNGWYMDENGLFCYHDVDNDTTGVYSSAYNYRSAKIGALASVAFGATLYAARNTMFGWKAYMGEEVDTQNISFNLDDPDMHYRASVRENIIPSTEIGYPAYPFFDSETNVKITDLKSVLNSHAEAESAKFITGARDLSELDQYFDELDALGYQDYLKIYTDYLAK